jgi:hypothetical protein
MVWRSSSALGPFLHEIARTLKQLPKALLKP